MTTIPACVVKGEADNALAGRPRNQLDAMGRIVIDHVFQTLIQILRIFTDNDKIHIFIAAFDTGDRMHRPQIGIRMKHLAQLHIDGTETGSDRCRGRPLEGDSRFLDRIRHSFFKQSSALFVISGTGGELPPVNSCIQGFRYLFNTFCNFRSNAVAGNQYCVHGTSSCSIFTILPSGSFLEYNQD